MTFGLNSLYEAVAFDSETPRIANTVNTQLRTWTFFMMEEITPQENRAVFKLLKMSRKVYCMMKIHQEKFI